MKTYEISYNCESDNRVYNEKNTTTTKKNKAMKLYKVHFYQAYRADECGTRWLPFMPSDSVYQKSDILQEREVTLPDGVTYNKENNLFAYKGKDCELVNEEDGTLSLVTDEEIINLGNDILILK